jgi:hypothetical protein
MPNRHRKLAQTSPADKPKAAGDGYDRPAPPEFEEFSILVAIAISLIFCIAAVSMSINNFVGMWTLPATTRATMIFAARVLLLSYLFTGQVDGREVWGHAAFA